MLLIVFSSVKIDYYRFYRLVIDIILVLYFMILEIVVFRFVFEWIVCIILKLNKN